MPPDSDVAAAVRALTLPTEGNPFEELLASVRLEDVGKGRRSAVLVKVDEAGGVPVVRTTTRYAAPPQRFRPVHERLAQRIQECASLSAGFNNALVEIYTSAYTTMGSHSDQAVDLADESFIALFSCYKRPEMATPPRKLLVEPKGSGGDHIAIPLTQNSVVVFSVDANRRFRHKIVLDTPARTPENPWLGITFRTSKTFLRFLDERVYLPDGVPLVVADDGQRREFYRLRRRENEETDFTYPRVTYTVSESDTMPPDPGEGSYDPLPDDVAGR